MLASASVSQVTIFQLLALLAFSDINIVIMKEYKMVVVLSILIFHTHCLLVGECVADATEIDTRELFTGVGRKKGRAPL